VNIQNVASQEAKMSFHDQFAEDAYARQILERAQIRAMARRQLALSIPVAAAAAFVAIISSFSFGHAAAPSDDQRAPISAPAAPHSTMLC
jgi:hypothetical protein